MGAPLQGLWLLLSTVANGIRFCRDGSDAVTATSIADVSSAAVGALGGNADDTDSGV